MSKSLTDSYWQSYQSLQDYCKTFVEKNNGSCPVPSFDSGVLNFASCEYGLDSFAIPSLKSCSTCSLSGSAHCTKWESVKGV